MQHMALLQLCKGQVPKWIRLERKPEVSWGCLVSPEGVRIMREVPPPVTAHVIWKQERLLSKGSNANPGREPGFSLKPACPWQGLSVSRPVGECTGEPCLDRRSSSLHFSPSSLNCLSHPPKQCHHTSDTLVWIFQDMFLKMLLKQKSPTPWCSTVWVVSC